MPRTDVECQLLLTQYQGLLSPFHRLLGQPAGSKEQRYGYFTNTDRQQMNTEQIATAHQDLSLIRALKSGQLEPGSCVQALPKLVLHLRTWRTSCRPMGWPAGSVEEELRNIIRQFR